MSFILDALRKSDAKRRAEQPPEFDPGPPSRRPPRRSGSRARRIIFALVAVVVVAAGVVGYLERDRLGEQIVAWTGQAEPVPAPEGSKPAESDSRPATTQADPEVRSSRPSDRATASGDRPGADLDDPETALPRERIVSDPEAIERELERLAGARAAEDDAAEPEPAPPRRDRRTLRQPTNIVVAESRDLEQRQREQEEREQEALAQMEQRMAAARERREARARAAERARETARSQPAEAEPVAGRAAENAANEPAAPEPGQVAAPTVPAERRELAVATAPTVPIEPEPSDEPWAPQAPEYVRVWELPLSVRRNLPDLTLNIHVYSDEPRQRFVLVNGERFRTGDALADGVRLVEIRREGAILDFRDYRFLLDP